VAKSLFSEPLERLETKEQAEDLLMKSTSWKLSLNVAEIKRQNKRILVDVFPKQILTRIKYVKLANGESGAKK
jgi:hypothetical protein